MTDRELLATAVEAVSPLSREYAAKTLVLQTGRWGSCAECPVVDGRPKPGMCRHTSRSDHSLDWTAGGRFYFEGKQLRGDRLQQRAQLLLRIEQARAA